ncbi:hypothetical protein M2145_002910 [Lachnospiraceae bacterium PF1-21]
MRFKGRIGVIVLLIILLINYQAIKITIQESKLISKLILLIILFMLDAIIIDMMFLRNYTEIKADKVVTRVGLITSNIPIKEIISIGRTYNPLAGMSLSFIRLKIRTKSGSYYIAVKDEKNFLHLLKGINPNISFLIGGKNTT